MLHPFSKGAAPPKVGRGDFRVETKVPGRRYTPAILSGPCSGGSPHVTRNVTQERQSLFDSHRQSRWFGHGNQGRGLFHFAKKPR